MSRQVIIYMPEPGIDSVQWAMADDAGRLVGRVESGTLADAAAVAEGLRVTLILRGGDVLLSEVQLPGASQARALQAAPFALEEQLADDVDELHFALGAKLAGDRWPVAVIGRETMDAITAACAAAGLRPTRILPETLALPSASTLDGLPLWHALLDQDDLIVRLDDLNGFATDSDVAALATVTALKEYRARRAARAGDTPEGVAGGGQSSDAGTTRSSGQEGQSQSTANDVAAERPVEAVVALYHTQAEASLDLPVTLDIDWRPSAHRLELYAAGIAKSPGINLLQGEYSPRQGFDKAWKSWRWTAVLAAALGAVWLGSQWLDYRRLSDHEAWLDRQIEVAFEEALPGTRMRRPRRQIEAALSGGGNSGADTFTVRLAQIADSLATQPQTELRSLGYRDGRFDLDLTTDAVPTLDALQTQLGERGSLSMTVQSANRQDGEIRGRVRIE